MYYPADFTITTRTSTTPVFRASFFSNPPHDDYSYCSYHPFPTTTTVHSHQSNNQSINKNIYIVLYIYLYRFIFSPHRFLSCPTRRNQKAPSQRRRPQCTMSFLERFPCTRSERAKSPPSMNVDSVTRTPRRVYA